MCELIESKIVAFDTLLGGGITPGSIVLLRGVRGTGKTTLALQLANRYAEKYDVTYISLETDPKILKERLGENYNLEKVKTAQIDDSNDNVETKPSSKDGPVELSEDNTADSATDSIKPSTNDVTGSTSENIPLFKFASKKCVDNGISNNTNVKTLSAFAEWLISDSKRDGKRVIFIDSLNALLDFPLRKNTEINPRINDRYSRNSFIEFYEIIRANNKDEFILFLIGEGDGGGTTSIISESYFCDVEIELKKESILSEKGFEHRKSEIQKHTSQEIIPVYREHTEQRNFIRVIKSRGTASQGRRCAYDFKKGEGLKFYETYPGDGLITFFAENEPQQNEWREFLAEDVMEHSSYPALDFGVFGRRSLRRAFSSMRRYFYIPERTDMHLGSFDSYWATWYMQFYERVKLKELFKDLKCKRPDSKRGGETDDDYAKRVKDTENNFRKIVGKLHVCYCEYKKNHHDRNAGKKLVDDLYDGIKKICLNCNDKKGICGYTEPIEDFIKEKIEDFINKNNDFIKRNKVFINGEIGDFIREDEGFIRGNEGFIKEEMKNFIKGKFDILVEKQKKGGLLEKLPFDRLRLFGELRSPFIDELPSVQLEKEGSDSIPYLDSIPYNANVGFMVYRKDLLKKVLSDFKSNERYVGKFKRELENLIVDVEEKWLEAKAAAAVAEAEEALTKAKNAANIDMEKTAKVKRIAEETNNAKTEKINEIKDKAKAIADFAGERLVKDCIPQTWEEIFVLCQGDDKNNRLVLMETRTNSSLMCTFLEFFWSYGIKLNINIDASYEVENEDKVKEAMFKALYMMSLFFREELTPRNSTLCAEDFSLKYADKDNWLFARHWFSTFVDVLTAKDDQGNFLWNESKNIDLGIMHIPVTFSSLLDDVDLQTADTSGLGPILDSPENHHSCWGKWSFGLFHGSENKELAIDLINNVMNSTNILDRAKSCAAVPTVKEFYDIHGELECFNIPFSENINIPSQFSYEKLKNEYLKHANTRATIFDYHHCSSEFTALVEYVRSAKNLTSENLMGKIEDAFDRIKKYNLKDMLSW